MANQTVYPYGTGGSLPSSIGIVNDLKTGGVDKALSAEQGKYIGNALDTMGTTTEQVLDMSDITLNVGSISTSGAVISSATSYRYTSPIYFGNKTVLIVKYTGGLIAPVSTTDASGSSYTPLYQDTHTVATESTITLVVDANTYIAFSYYVNGDFEVRYSAVLTDALYGKSGYEVSQSGKSIGRSLELYNVNSYIITTPFWMEKGQTVQVNTRGGLMSVVTRCSSTGDLLECLVFSSYTNGDISRVYQYTADNDMYVAICGRDGMTVEIFGAGVGLIPQVSALNSMLGGYRCGVYLYPFKAIVGKRVILYKDSIASGLKPSCNFQVDCRPGDNTQNYTTAALSYLPTTAGTENINVRVMDEFNKEICAKTVSVTSVTMPSVKLANSEQIDVLWMGDSLIAFNGNLIGAEWYRMLATDDQETHIDSTTGAKQLPTYNVCPGKLRLVGEQSWEARYMYAYRISTLMTGKRSTGYNPNRGHNTSSTENPWYNPNSSQPDEVGEDGFNKRVDLAWYFDNACGQGKYPKLFYLAIGANDAPKNGWNFDLVEETTNNFVLLCKKIKKECDAIAGGESGIKIKVLNHQTYPLDNMYNYENNTAGQRLLWNRLYDSYYNAIKNVNNGISGYVELIDCASKFDWRVGYTQEKIASNVRYNGGQDIFIAECCHLNNVGAYNYADALIDDFLADADYD